MNEIVCPFLDAFDPTDISAVTEAFAGSPDMPMKQAWKSEPDKNFQPGSVRIGWRADRLWIHAQMIDLDIFTSAQRDNDRLWECGDVFEIFLEDPRFPGYVEFHVAPSGHRMQLVFREEGTFRRISQKEVPVEDFFVADPLFYFFAGPCDGGWQVVASVPLSVFDPTSVSLAGLVWRASFCRYDGSSSGQVPVLSSTSEHKIVSFHIRDDWKNLRFV